MPSRTNVSISRTMYLTTAPIVYVSRIFGLAPFVIKKNGEQYIVQWSHKYAAYSYILASTLATLSLVGIVRDFYADDSKTIRMKKSIRNLTCADISIIIMTVLIGVFGMKKRLSKFWTFVDCLNEVDSTITTVNVAKTRKTSIGFLILILLIAFVILITDIGVWWYKIAWKQNCTAFFLQNYISFYILYCAVILMECQFWHIISCIKRRIIRLNHHLMDDNKWKIEEIVKPKTNKKVVSTLIDNLSNVKKVTEIKVKVSDDYITKLIRVHEKIYEAVVAATDCYSLTVLVIILSCLLHLILTPFFLLLELNGTGDNMFIILKVIWIFAHLGRLLLVVEPCYSCLAHAKMTGPLVCKLLTGELNDTSRKQLEIFAIQLFHRQIEFSLCGLAKIDRQLLTGIAGAVTTYLVILFQFERHD